MNNQVNSLEMGILITIWRDELQRHNETKKIFQKLDLKTMILSLYNSLM